MSAIPFAILAWSCVLFGGGSVARAGEHHAFTAGLSGEPEVGCIVTTEDGACARGHVRGALVPDGGASFAGQFEFNLPGLRNENRQPLRRAGQGRLEGLFTSAGGEAPRHCVIRGRVSAQGIALPSGSSVKRFHTGSFVGRGRCDQERVRLRAIWSGGIGPASEPMIFDFERFQGRLAGTLMFRRDN